MSLFARRAVRITAAITAAVTISAVCVPLSSPAAAAVNRRPRMQHERTLAYRNVVPRRQRAIAAPVTGHRAHTAWPAAGSATVSVAGPSTASRSGWQRAGRLPIEIGRVPARTTTTVARPASGRYAVTVASQSAAQRAGVAGVLFSVRRQTSDTSSTAVRLDYASFAAAGGANFGQRLRLVQMPECALTTPTMAACRVQTPVNAVNDPGTQALSTTLVTGSLSPRHTARTAQPTLAQSAGSTSTFAAVAGTSGASDDFTATSLAPSGSWTAGGSSGGFDWSYPIALPPASGGSDVAPTVALAYDSSSVDGRIASTNNQDGPFGEGWDYSPGYVERTYRSCVDDTALVKADRLSDQCWAGQILTYSLGGSSSAIVQDDSSGKFHLKSDDGSRVELIGAGTGAYQNEYWKITTTDGVQYYFGRDTLPGGSTTNATWTAPVCGDVDTDCTGTGSGSISPFETQAWRWNLDYVVDPHDNATAYYYAAETGYYGQNNKTTPKSYTRGGYLTRIDYGLRATATTLSTPSDRVVFTSAERCLTTCTTFDAAHSANWPDTPQSLDCASTGTCNTHAPTFWSRKRITTISTEYYSGSGSTYYLVDQYKLTQSFPTTGDPELELDKITRTGHAAGTTFTVPSGGAPTTTDPGLTLPAVSFTYQLLDNRIAGYNSQPAMQMWRLNQIATETGEKILVFYDQAGRAPAQCTKTTVPTDPSNDTSECYPVYWTPTGYTTPQLDWFHKHLVTEVDADDANGTAANRYATYTYVGAPAWHYDDNEVVKPKNRTYGQFRGYQTVQVRTGNPNHASNGVPDAWTLASTTYYRGMDGDTLPNNQTRSASVSDSLGNNVPDSDQYAGMPRETQTFLGDTSTEVSATIATPTTAATTATQARTGLPNLVARMVRPGTSRTITDVAGGTTRYVQQDYDYDSIGRLVHQTDTGSDVDPLCTTTDYADNTTSWIRSAVSETIKSAQVCPTGTTAPTNIVKDTRTYYDGSATLGDVPNKGEASEVDIETTSGHWAVSTAKYDGEGRVTDTTVDAAAGDVRAAHIAYTPTAGGPLTKKVTTNPAGQIETVLIDPSRGEVLENSDVATRKTDATYDPVGRITAVYRPGQAKGTDSATTTYAYTYGPTAPLAVVTKQLIDPGNGATPGYVTHVDIYDAFGQLRQTQDAAEGGGRNIADTFTDGHGWKTQTNDHWHTTGSPATTLITTAQSGIDASTRTLYDGAGRPTFATDYNGTSPTRTTQSVYGGDRTTVIPPNGGVETTQVTDARGETVETDQWTSPPKVQGDNTLKDGTAERTSYAYDVLGRRVAETTAVGTPAAATWTHKFDLAGREYETDDPDSGATTNQFDDANETISTTDANGDTLAYAYDQLGRKVGEYDGSIDPKNLLASWTFDTIQNGELSSSQSITPEGNYTETVLGYTPEGRPTGTEVDLPAGDVQAGFAASYTSKTTWTTTGLASTVTPASGGSLPTETIHEYYDAFGNQTASTGYTAYVSAAAYSAYGEPSQYTLGVNNQTAWLTLNRDAETRRITSVNLSAQVGTPQLENVAYGYDASGNITSATDTEGAPGTATETSCYDYDALDRLIDAWSASDGCAVDVGKTGSTSTIDGPQPYWLSWSFDAAGSRIGQTVHAVPTGVPADLATTYNNGVTTSTLNGSTTNDPHVHALAASSTSDDPAVTSSYVYDPDGNTVSRTVAGQTSAFTYTPDGRTHTITQGANEIASYSYDADGNQLIRRDPTTETLFLPGEELTLNKSDQTITGTRFYSFNNTVVALRVGHANTIYQYTDLRGTSLTEVPTNSAGVLTPVRRHLDPYGNPLPGDQGTPAAWNDTHGLMGKSLDATTGLLDVGARTLDPSTGRFLTVDPVFDPDNPQQDNGYSYANGNPIGMSDPDGTDPDPDPNHSSLHEAAVTTAAQAIQYYLQNPVGGAVGGDPDAVTTTRGDNEIPASSGKRSPSNSGFADIVYHDDVTDTFYVWEVKGTRTSNVAAVNRAGRDAAKQVQRYVGALQSTLNAEGRRSRVMPGPGVGVLPFQFGGQNYIDFDFMPGSGAIVYAMDPTPGDGRKPSPKPVPVTDPRSVPVPTGPMPTAAPRMPGDFKGRIWNPINPGPALAPSSGLPTGGASSGGGGGWGVPNIEVPQFSLTPTEEAAITGSVVVGVFIALAICFVL